MHPKKLSLLSALLWAIVCLSSWQQVCLAQETILDLDKVEHDVNKSAPASSSSATKLAQDIHKRYEDLLSEARDGNDNLPDGMLLPLSRDPDCSSDDDDCFAPPQSTIETMRMQQQVCNAAAAATEKEDVCTMEDVEVDKHWGSDKRILAMRDRLRKAGSGMYDRSAENINENDTQKSSFGNTNTKSDQSHHQEHPFDANQRPPIFLMPGLAATRLVSWKHKTCPHSALLSDIKFNDYVWLNMKLLVQMGTIAVKCWEECMTLGRNQTDSDLADAGCKLRPDEGLDAIASLAPGGVSAELLVGHTNTLFAWLVQWLADNLGYDLSNIIGLPYDWRLSPHMMEKRDGFLSQTRRRIEAAVKANGGVPGIMVAHSMGNSVFRYFLVWLKHEMRDEAFQRISTSAERRAKRNMQQQQHQQHQQQFQASGQQQQQQGWMSGVANGFDELWNSYFPWQDEVGGESSSSKDYDNADSSAKTRQFWELAKIEADQEYMEWIEAHIWTYVGLSAPILGAINPLRSVISGENMGLPFSDEIARRLELSFGCTNTVNPISAKMAFCDNWASGQFGDDRESELRADLFCLDSLVREIEESTSEEDPWTSFPTLERLLKKRVDWDTDVDMITIIDEHECEQNDDSPQCETKIPLGARHVQNGNLFRAFSSVWNEENKEMDVKREQLEDSYWYTSMPNMLNRTWDRPHIKHVIMAYGVDVNTEVGYEYRKRRETKKKRAANKEEFDGPPVLAKVIWESARGVLEEEQIESSRGGLTEVLIKKKPKVEPFRNGSMLHSGDGTIPYLSLSWAHTWLLHAIRAQRHTYGKQQGSILDTVQVSHRPEDQLEWRPGRPPEKQPVNDKRKKADTDTGTSHPHGTKYKPEMVRFHNVGKSRNTGMEYSTTVIEAAGVEHKETTRNYDILAAVFSEMLIHMHDDFGLV